MLILGAGKHAKVVFDVAKTAGVAVEGIIAPDKQTISTLPNLGDDTSLPKHKGKEFIVAVGDNLKRKELFELALKAGLKPKTLIHPSAIISQTSILEPGTVIMARVVIQPDAHIGQNCIINTAATIDHDCEVFDHVHIAPGVHVSGSVYIGQSAFIGTGSSIVDGVTIGEGAIIGAGTAVYKDVSHQHTMVGASMRILRRNGPKKVLIFAPVVGRGGVHRLVERMTKAWTEYADPKEWEFAALSQVKDENGIPINWGHVPLTELGEHPPHPHLFSFLTINQRQYLERLQDMAKDFDVVWLPHPWWTMRAEGWRLDIPIVATIPDFAFDTRGKESELAAGFRKEAQMIARHAAMVCFPSNYQRTWGELNYGMSKTRTINYAEFLPEEWKPTKKEAERVRKKYNLPKRYALAFHCAHHKDPITILKGHEFARSKHADVPVLVLAGLETEVYRPGKPASGHAQEVQKVIKQCGYTYEKDLFILGRVDDEDIAGLYAGAQVAYTASTSEGGLSATVYEAFSAGTPLVYSNIPPFVERLGMEHQYGWQFPVGDFRAFGNAIVERFAKPEAAAQRATNAQQFISGRTWKDVAQDYLQVFKEVIR